MPASITTVPGSKPRGLLRLVFRLPIAVYRLHLGWLFGRRMLLVTHRGRTSGRIYRTMLEVVRYDPATHESIVVAGYGPRADWYQNIQAQPAIAVQTGLQRYAPLQRVLTPDEVDAELASYERRHRWITKPLLGLFYGYDGTAKARRELAERLPMVGFRPAK